MTSDVQITGWDSLTPHGVKELLRIVRGWTTVGVCPSLECQTCPMAAMTAKVKHTYKTHKMFTNKEYNVCAKNVGLTLRDNCGKIFINRNDMIELIEHEMEKWGMTI